MEIKVRTTCETCGTPLRGSPDNLLRRGNKFYCRTHYEKTSPEEKQNNKFQELRHKIYKEVIS